MTTPFVVWFLAFFLSQTTGFVVLKPELSGKELVEYINSAQSLFVAELTELTDDEMRFKVMDEKFAEPRGDEQYLDGGEIIPEPLPDTFDARDNWPECKSIKLIRNQATCGSCWAFGAAEIISDRECIQSNATRQPIISVDDILSCCGETCGLGCDGGYTIEALRFWNHSGVVTGGDYGGDGCRPYPFTPCKKSPCAKSATPICEKKCQSGYETKYSSDKHFGSTSYYVTNTVGAIKTEIYHNGPVEASFKVYADFYQYKSGIYKYTGGKLVGGHAVKIIGWGNDNGVDYWLIANSWGTTFGEDGFFRMVRGTNECGIESNVVAGLANLGVNDVKDDDDGGAAGTCSLFVCFLSVLTLYLI
uniref:Pept_C1 domain-containing protein n=1 Tax=Caenorhabditis japonica TaxID=281687 RepID=A0A8R1IP54_CAEJA